MLTYFRSKGGKVYGWGNVIRMAHLAKYLKDHRGHKIIFFYEGDKDLKEFLNNFSFKKIRLKNNISYREEKNLFKKFSKSRFFFLENLDTTFQLQKLYKSKSDKLVIFDDLLDKAYYSDFLICAQERTMQMDICRDKNTKVYIGNKFFPFSQEILKKSIFEKKLEKNISTIMILLGGGNYEGAYIKIAKALKGLKFKKISMVVGSSYSDDFVKFLKKINNKLILYKSLKNIGDAFSKHDISIVSGGYTKFEAAVMKSPSLIISTQWHQLDIAENFSKKTGCLHLGHFSKCKVSNIRKGIKKLGSFLVRKKIISSYQKIVSKKGNEKVLEILKI